MTRWIIIRCFISWHKHIDLPPFTNMRVNLVAQVLSQSMVLAMNTCITVSELPLEAEDTLPFTDRFDKHFDSFNSRRLFTSKRYNTAMSDGSVHIPFLKESLQVLEEVKLPNGKTLPYVEGWKQDITALLLLWSDLQDNHDFSYLYTSCLNQDCCENLVSNHQR